jgi:hypothetical protein
MSKEKQPVKKTIITSKKAETSAKKEKVKPTASARVKTPVRQGFELIYGWSQYKIILIGIGLITIGMLLMLGGHMPSPDVWDDSIIYSFRRTVLAPAFIVAGLLVEVYAIFKD